MASMGVLRSSLPAESMHSLWGGRSRANARKLNRTPRAPPASMQQPSSALVDRFTAISSARISHRLATTPGPGARPHDSMAIGACAHADCTDRHSAREIFKSSCNVSATLRRLRSEVRKSDPKLATRAAREPLLGREARGRAAIWLETKLSRRPKAGAVRDEQSWELRIRVATRTTR